MLWRAGIERELVSRSDLRVLRWFDHAGTRESEVRLDGWCEGGLGLQRNDGGGCATMHERVESPGTYVTK